MKIDAIEKRIYKSLLFVGPAASLMVAPWTNYDPINPIKLLFVTGISFYILSLIIFSSNIYFLKIPKIVLYACLGFVISMLLTVMFVPAPFDQQFWGSFGRNTGFLTYFSLVVLLLSFTGLSKVSYARNLIFALIYTAIPMTAYCLVQVSKSDPIGWSEKLPFGTLGNINFSSAFFGLSSIACLSIILDRSVGILIQLSLTFMVFVDLLIVQSTGSIQGLLIFASGGAFLILGFLKNSKKMKLLSLPFIGLVSVGIVGTLFGLANRGPLAKFLFAPSIVFRTDYWHAGWKMTIDHPIFGVGLDSYGDWYRQARGELSTLRNSPDRISNTAHNIFLDISSNGGFLLLAFYLVLVFYTFLLSIRFLKKNQYSDHTFNGLFSVWIGFLVMSAVSINQIGVGIWGWLFQGALIGYINCKLNFNSKENTASRVTNKKLSKRELPPSAVLISFVGLFVGLSLAFVPLRADSHFRSALNSGSLENLINSSKVVGSTSFHLELTLQQAISQNSAQQAYEIAKDLTKRYPKDFMGWKVLWLITLSTPEEKNHAHQTLLELDPFNPTIK